MSTTQYDQFRDTPLWRAVSDIVSRLESSGEIKVETAPDYVVGFMCQELAAKWVVVSDALRRDPRG